MKKTLILFIAVFISVSFSQNLNSQTELTEGIIKMEITDVTSQMPELEMMKGTITEYHFNKDKSLVLANMMGGMVELKSLIDNTTEDLKLYFNMMGTKMLVESSKEERDELQGSTNENAPDISISYDEEDTKNILGYDCVKASWDTPEGIEFAMYIAPDITASNKLIQGMQNIDLQGFPLEYEMSAPQMKLTYTATGIEQKIDPAVFQISDEGYQKMSLKEFMTQMGAMGGNLGF